tara:strand:+ start:227 stop:367 length:141 start_codon:yes stop_codon:yes gene_type:complete
MVANICHITPKETPMADKLIIYTEMREDEIKHDANTFLHVNTFSHV